MKHLSKLTVAGTLLLISASTAYAESTNAPSTSSSPTQPQQTTPGPSNQPLTVNPAPQASQPSAATSQAAVNIPNSFTPDSIQWKEAPTLLPAGAQVAFLEGTPKGKGNVTVRVKFPANYQLAPVYTRSSQRVTVISGTVNLGYGDTVNKNAGKAFPAGSFISVPANKHHYLWTTEESVLQISGTGPWELKYVNAKEDPRKNQAASTTTGQAQPNVNQPQNQPATSQPASSVNSNTPAQNQ
jgi:hypothetical protein